MLLFVTLVVLVIAGANYLSWKRVHVAGQRIAEEQIITLSTIYSDSAVAVVGLEIIVSGDLDGTAELWSPIGGTVTLGPGTFRREFAGEYYGDTARLKYSPIDVRSGELRVRYRFHSL